MNSDETVTNELPIESNQNISDEKINEIVENRTVCIYHRLLIFLLSL